ncbi:MAG: transcriptional repressor [Caldilineaceae bacterium]|nr:transcriptional repressor [Caldilineaceae bacterium]
MSDTYTSHFDTYISVLRDAGCRITEQRQRICRYLAETDQHPTPYQVYSDLRSQYPDMNRATVYNTLNTLQSLGAIVEINFGANHTHYDTDPTPHVNLICLRCHAIEDCHEALPTDEILTKTGTACNFTPIAAKIDILGICARCRAQDA